MNVMSSLTNIATLRSMLPLLRAEIDVIRRQRLLFWGLGAVGIVAMTPVLVLLAAVYDGLQHGAGIGGRAGYAMAFGWLLAVIPFFAALVGTSAGAVDHRHGVYRELILAGTERWQVHLAQIGAACAVAASAAAAAGLATRLVVSTAHGHAAAPGIVASSVDIVVLSALAGCVAIAAHAVGSVIRSRGLAMVVILVWATAVEPLVVGMATLVTHDPDNHLARWSLGRALEQASTTLASQPHPQSAILIVATVVAWASILSAGALLRSERADV